LSNTHSVDATGLSSSNVSPARDLIKLVNAAYRHPLIRDLSINPGKWVQVRGPRYGLQYGNTNPLVRSSRWNVSLSKTGYLDAAGRCLVMVAEMDGEPRVVVLLDSLGTRTPRSEEHRLNSSHVAISYAVFCLKKKTRRENQR